MAAHLVPASNRHRSPIVIAAVVLSAALVSSAPAEAQLTTKATVIMSKRSGKCVNIEGASGADGAAALQWRCDASPNGTFKLVPFSTHFRLVATHSGKCLAVSGGSTASGAAVVQAACSGVNSEQWTVQTFGKFYRLVARHTGMCLNVFGNDEDQGAALIQWPCGGGDNEVWSFGDGFLSTGQRARLVSSSNLCTDISGNSTAENAGAVQWTCKAASSAGNQSWALSRQAEGYRISVQHSGKCLNVLGASTAESAQVVQTTCSTASSQTWLLQASGSAWKLVNKNSNKCLDLGGDPAAPGTGLVQKSCASVASQTWRVSAENSLGAWSAVINLPLVPVAAAALNNRKVVLWSAYDAFDFGGDNGKTQTALFDPQNNSVVSSEVSNTQHDMFCPGTAMLPDGRLLVNGGSSAAKTSIYNPATQSWSPAAQMNVPRGYNADTVTDNGKVFTIGGSWSGGQGGKRGEVWTSSTGWSQLSGVPAGPMTGPDPQGVYRGDNHAWLFGTGSGKVFHAGPSAQMNWFDTTGSGSSTSAGNRSDDQYSMNGNAVMYDINRILKVGGAPAYQNANALTSAYVINISSGVAASKTGSMSHARSFQNSVVLPDGRVVVVGGESFPVPFSDSQAILPAEIWSPGSGAFSTVAAMNVPRTYHSVALLLADARVLVGGGGLCGGCDNNHPNLQYYSPGYLFQANGQAASRPSITSAPSSAGYGGQISVVTNRAVSSFSLVRMASVTHTTNNDQRRVPLSIAGNSGNTYTVNTPANAGIATPGYYMLFALDSAGVPSVAAIIRIQ
jgi:galactose oxidase